MKKSLLLFFVGLLAVIISPFIDNKLLFAFIFLLSQAFSCILILIHQGKGFDFKDIRLVFVFCLLLYTMFYPLVALLGFLYIPNFLDTTVYLLAHHFLEFILLFYFFLQN